MLFLPISFVVALVIIGTRALFNSKSRLPDPLKQLLQQLNQRATAILSLATRFGKLKGASGPQTKTSGVNGTTKTGILKQVHFAEVIATSSGDSPPTKQSSNGQQLATAPGTKTSGKKCDKNNNKAKQNNAGEQQQQQNRCKRQASVPEIEEFDIDSLVEATTNYSVISKANLIKKQHQQQQLNKKLGRKRHNSDGGKLNYSSEQLFKLIAASCLSKEEVEMAVETLLNKLESGEAQWNQPKNDPLMKLKGQLRESEAALTTETHNHEQARARLVELKQQLQSERASKAQAAEEVVSVKKEFSLVSVALERARDELANQRAIQQRVEEEKLERVSKLEKENAHLRGLVATGANKSDETSRLRRELDDKHEQLRRYELANESVSKANQELEARLRNAELRANNLEAERRNGDYEACAKIADLEADRGQLEKALKDHMVRLNELLAANSILEKSLNDARLLNNQQDDVIKRLQEERRINEASMQRALCEMETELRTLHEQLSNKTSTNDERYRKDLNHFERELNEAGQREQKLSSTMIQLRDGLSELFPDLQATAMQTNSDDWVHQYLRALKQLTATVDELRRSKGNNNNNSLLERSENGSEHSNQSTPSKRSGIDKSTLTLHTNGKSTRVGSPSSNGRSSRASSNYDREKKLMETKLVEFQDYVSQLEDKIRALELSNSIEGMAAKLDQNEQQINDLEMQRTKLKAQINFGLDSFKLQEQERAGQHLTDEELCPSQSNQRTVTTSS